MPKIATRWPMLSISDVDFDIIKELRALPGVFRSAESRDILMTAAALGYKMNLPEAVQARTFGNDIMNGATLSSAPLSSYRQFIILIYFKTKVGDSELTEMSDTKAMVENFKDYAHRGLLYLREKYKEPHGNEELLKQYENALLAVRKKLKSEKE